MNDAFNKYPPDAVVFPENEEDAIKVVNFCRTNGIPLIPFGAGSGVCGGTLPVQGGVVMDMKRMRSVTGLDEASCTVTVEAGILGAHLEEFLNEKGYTLGHFPSSLACSTVGGYAATRSAGQYSSRYGKIEDMIAGLRVVRHDGAVCETSSFFGETTAPDWLRIFTGSEGTLCVITGITLKIVKKPSFMKFRGFRFGNLKTALEGMRHVMQSGLKPALFRLYDDVDTLINNLHPKKLEIELPQQAGKGDQKSMTMIQDFFASLTQSSIKYILSHPSLFRKLMDALPLPSLLLIGFEGDRDRVNFESSMSYEALKRAGGEDLGEEPGLYWYNNRYAVSFKQSKIYSIGAFVDTIEVSAQWSRLYRIYSKVVSAVSPKVFIMAHFSHTYREGCSIYFTFAGYRSDTASLVELYDWTTTKILETAIANQSSVSHHHGIGFMKRNFIHDEYIGGDKVFAGLKHVLDPEGIFNPGKIYPPGAFHEGNALQTEPEEDANFTSLLAWHHSYHSREGGDLRIIRAGLPEEVEDLIKTSQRNNIKVFTQIPQGCEKPGHAGVRLYLDGMEDIIEADFISGAITVQAGMKLKQIEGYLFERGFTLGYIPKNIMNLTAGEYISAGGGTEHGGLYGCLRENVLGLSAIMPDGGHFTSRPAPRRAAGPDQNTLFEGGLGKFGVVTAVCLRVFPRPQVEDVVAYGTERILDAFNAVVRILENMVLPKRIFVLIRPNSTKGNQTRTRIAVYLSGSREMVSYDLGVVRRVVSAMDFAKEEARPETRQDQRTHGTDRTFLYWKDMMNFFRGLEEKFEDSIPEMHIRNCTLNSASVSFVMRSDSHKIPEKIASLRAERGKASLSAESAALKKFFDRNTILNA
ncbi:MAG: FAD-binding oxidoreductase [Deltaproteobacteria bacterium]|nr:FAD-binding oxidoreductase [Deltaproteobacteria bacterium]